MVDIVLFGGTSEGRALCELLAQRRIPSLVCVATEYGEALLGASETLRVRTGRLDKAAMEALFRAETPRLVIDATHPYAAEVSANLRAACQASGTKLLRLLREPLGGEGCAVFSDMDKLIGWVNGQSGAVFSTFGAKEAAALTAVEGYQERVWLRILPDAAGLSACLAAGFPAKRIICMQGPFSRELNVAMFRRAGSAVLLTKESGAAGGYVEKLEAARECGMATAALARPREESGLTFAEVITRIEEVAP